jgi:hypothetical protein
MKNKKCNKIIERYLQLDKNQRLPLAITLHILSCKSCKNKIRMMSLAEESIKEPISIAVPITDNSIEQIMQKISPESYNKITKNPISMTNWIISGIITILLLCASVIFASKFNSSALTFIYTLISGTAIITYCCAFVISNIDFFIKKISFIR